MAYPIPETERTINGVNGRASAVYEPREIRGRRVHLNQTWKASRLDSAGECVTVEMRFDDSCKNGHQTFAITGDTRDSFGCIHDTIAEVFPELAPLIKWHGCSTDGPMHYVANTVYLAGDRDHYGLRKGEKRRIIGGKTGLPSWRLVAVDDTGQEIEIYTLRNMSANAHEPPANTMRLEWRPLYRTGEGKPRELDAARRDAIWPDATDEQLSAEPAELRASLEARLPALLAEFRAAMESCGFLWDSEA